MTTGLGPNAVQECPSPARLKTHRAHGVFCATCMPDLRHDVRCPLCLDLVPAVGAVIQPHDVEGRGLAGFPCPGSGATVEFPEPVERPVWRPGMRRMGVVGSPLVCPHAGGDAA